MTTAAAFELAAQVGAPLAQAAATFIASVFRATRREELTDAVLHLTQAVTNAHLKLTEVAANIAARDIDNDLRLPGT